MSLFAGEQPQLGVFSTVGAPTIAVPQVAPATGLGAGIYMVIPDGALNLANAVTNTNATTATALMTYVFPGGSLNTLSRIIDIYAAGEYTTDSGTARTITLALTFGDGTNTRTLGTWTTGATTASQTGMPWNFDFAAVVSTAGSSGKLFGHGTANVTLGASAAGALTSYNDTNTAASSTLDLTKQITLSVTQLYSGSNAGNTFTQDFMQLSFAG